MFHKTFEALSRQVSDDVPVSLSSQPPVESVPSLGAGVRTKWNLVCEDVNTLLWLLLQLRKAAAD